MKFEFYFCYKYLALCLGICMFKVKAWSGDKKDGKSSNSRQTAITCLHIFSFFFYKILLKRF